MNITLWRSIQIKWRILREVCHDLMEVLAFMLSGGFGERTNRENASGSTHIGVETRNWESLPRIILLSAEGTELATQPAPGVFTICGDAYTVPELLRDVRRYAPSCTYIETEFDIRYRSVRIGFVFEWVVSSSGEQKRHTTSLLVDDIERMVEDTGTPVMRVILLLLKEDAPRIAHLINMGPIVKPKPKPEVNYVPTRRIVARRNRSITDQTNGEQ